VTGGPNDLCSIAIEGSCGLSLQQQREELQEGRDRLCTQAIANP
jgi:hypothetical protein